jgi:hypothetical protein
MQTKNILAGAMAIAALLLGSGNADAGELRRRIENRLVEKVANRPGVQRILLRVGQRAANNPELQRQAVKMAAGAAEKAAKDPVIQKEVAETLARIAENAANDPNTRKVAREALEGMLRRQLEKSAQPTQSP